MTTGLHPHYRAEGKNEGERETHRHEGDDAGVYGYLSVGRREGDGGKGEKESGETVT